MNKRKISIYLLGTFLTASLAVYLWLPNSGNAQITKQSNSETQIGPPNFDAFGASQKRTQQNELNSDNVATEQPLEAGHLVQYEPRLGVPTFLWATNQGEAKIQSADGIVSRNVTESAAREHLVNYASRYRLNKDDVAKTQIASVHDTGTGAIIVKFKQTIDGIEVFRDELNIIMNRNLRLIALSGYLTGDQTPEGFIAAEGFTLQPDEALAKAVRDLTNGEFPTSALSPITENVAKGRAAGKSRSESAVKKEQNPYLLFTADNKSLQNFTIGEEPSRVKKVMFHLPEGYVPSYYVETSVNVPSSESVDINGAPITSELAYSYIISAVDGQILFRNNLTASEVSTFRVWADPTTKIPYDTPAGNDVHPKLSPVPDGAQYSFVPQNDITLNNYPFSRNDPWLPAGSTETVGNNVDAFANLINGTSPNYTATTDNGYGPVAPTPYSGVLTVANGGGDFRSKFTSGNNVFTHTNDAIVAPTTAEVRQANIQQLFYNLNFLHDWFYDAGFNEASGNAQTDNYGRGGLGNDNIKAQVQDISGRNNANMATGADGARPRMRMYVFDTYAPKYLDVQAPAAIAGQRGVGTAQAGPQAFDLTREIVYAAPTNACTALTNAAAVSGKVAMVQYPATLPAGCNIATMISNVQNAGGTGFLLVWLASSPTQAVNVTGANAAQTVPFLSISFNNASGIKTQIANGQTVTARFRRDAGNDRDGTIDNQIVFHEWGHYISNRLIGNGSGLGNMVGSGMGEGWADFTAMLALTVRPDDVNVASNSNWNGAYALATYATSGGLNGDTNQAYYYGIRRTPYSTDLTKDSLTFKHIQDGVALPNTSLYAYGQDGASNSEVHNTGEVWTSMLWECYAALLRDTTGSNPRLTFQQAQVRMKNYLVASYKMTPSSPTMLEARDALIAASFAGDPLDGALFAKAFSKRGAGTRAVAPDRFSTNNVGVTESFVVAGDVAVTGSLVADNTTTRDNDGYLDNGERGILTITAKNTGLTALNGETATISSNNPNVTFPNGNNVVFSNSNPGQNLTGTVLVALGTGQTGMQTSDFTITFNDPSFISPVTSHYLEYINVNEKLASSATDTIETRQTSWTTGFDTALNAPTLFNRAKSGSALNYFWLGPDSAVRSDQYLTSPIVTVDGSGSLNLQFDHSWNFESSGTTYYDGGVVEISVNNGAWTDIGSSAYNGLIFNGTGADNPIKGRNGFVGSSTGTIHTTLTQAVAAGSKVQIRFRVGTDTGGSANGWTIDNIALAGIVETPFATIIGDPNLNSTAASVTVSGKVVTNNGRGLPNARVEIKDTDGNNKFVFTNAFGNFTIKGVSAGSTYVISVSAKKYTFSPQIVSFNEDQSGLIISSN